MLDGHVQADALDVIDSAQGIEIRLFPGAGIDEVAVRRQRLGHVATDPGACTRHKNGFLIADTLGKCNAMRNTKNEPKQQNAANLTHFYSPD